MQKEENERHAQVDPEIENMQKKENGRHAQVDPEIEKMQNKKMKDMHKSI